MSYQLKVRLRYARSILFGSFVKMALIQLNFKSDSRTPEHLDSHGLTRIEYIHKRFLDAKKLATVGEPVYVTGVVAARDLKNIQNQFNIYPISKVPGKTKGFYSVTFLIRHDSVL